MSATASLTTDLWPGSDSLHIEALKRDVEKLKAHVREHETRCQERHSAVTQAVERLEMALLAEAEEARRILAHRDYQQARLDAHGLVPTAIAIVMAAVPDAWANNPVISLPSIGLAVGLLIAAIESSVRAGAWSEAVATAGQ